jgi:hypothetical protein
MSALYPKSGQDATQADDGEPTPVRSSQRRPSKPLKRVRVPDPPADPATSLDGAAIADIQAYIDTVELTFSRRPKGLLAEASRIMRRKVWFEDIKDDTGKRWATRLICHQPSPEMLHALDRYGGIISRLDIAFDNHSPINDAVDLVVGIDRGSFAEDVGLLNFSFDSWSCNGLFWHI